ncbi:non-specific serine/threonine protein kinase [Nonomuraea polychroma]|uniref:Non-specific serine/threonine protein kinase n=1 Tax=Nonomuraea polychroma TaxID=46176 RepID=A0A438M7N3_9ACTN|nr:LuxR family transcriptional regulator [Nonomuraea polychroma]RVX41734.1 non-specific serine/threonine protein kinase [Nonomuraea polychroma]
MGSLPVAESSFVGRRREITQVSRALSRARLVTLTGVGGVGKTRLALEVAARSERVFRDGVWVVDLAALRDGTLVARTVADTLGIQDRSGRPPEEQLAGYLADRALLIVLDNCEHLCQACALFAETMLRSVPGLRILATSRQTLGVPGEHVLVVPPLSVPDPDRLPPTAALMRREAVRLLADRATTGTRDFAVTKENRHAVAALCARLEGIPLAIELAAARLASLSIEQVVSRLEDRLALLTGGNPAALPRQQTLRATIDWSHALCTPQERRLWARLSVFAGGFDLDAAESVCVDADLGGEEILDLVDGLVKQSIIMRVEVKGSVRYRMLETIRDYGRERLAEQGEMDRLSSRHRDYFLGLVERMNAGWSGPGQVAALARLRTDHDNLRAALEWCMRDPAGPEPALALTAALRYHWCVGGYVTEGRWWLERALGLSGEPSPARTAALWVAAWTAVNLGDHRAAGRCLGECERLAEQQHDEVSQAYARTMRGIDAIYQGRVSEAIGHLEEAIAAHQRLEEANGILLSMLVQARSYSNVGDTARCKALAERTLTLSEELGERCWHAYALWAYGLEVWAEGDTERADDLARRGLSIQWEFNDAVGASLTIELLAWIAESRHELVRAARLLGAAGVIWRSIGASAGFRSPQTSELHDRCVRRVRHVLGEARCRAARQEAERNCTTVEQAIAYALHDCRPQPSGG